MTEKDPGLASPPGADAWITPGRFALLLGTLIMLTFPGVVLGWETFFFRDFGVFGYPLAHYQRECFWRGELPLWNPLNSCGLPFLAQWNTLTLYPLSLFYLVFPLSWSLGVFNLGHLFLAGMGMYFLCRRWTGNAFAAAVGGILFAFNGLTWHALMWPNDIAALGWMPWVVLAVQLAWVRGGGRMVCLAALAGAMQMLTGAPEIILLTWLFLGVLWLARFCFCQDVSRIKLLGRAASVGLLVAALTAAQILPFLDLLKHSHRDTGYGGISGWSMPMAGLANFFAPLFHCFVSSHGVYVQHDQYWVPSYYLGVGAMIFALLALWRPRDRRVWLLFAVAIAAIWMALGQQAGLYRVVMKALPVLGFMRYPIKFVVAAVFTIPILAAYGVSSLRAQSNFSAVKKLLACITFAILVLLGLLAWREWVNAAAGDDRTVTDLNILLRGVFVLLAMFAAIGLGRKTARFELQIALRVGLLLMLWMDVYTHAPNLSPTVKRSVYETGVIRAEFKLPPKPQPDDSRFMQTMSNAEQLRYQSLPDPANDYICRRLALFDDCNLLDDIPKTDGFYSLYLKDTLETLSLIYQADAKQIDLAGLKNFVGISHISAGAEREKALDWLPREGALPLVTTGQTAVFANESDTTAGLFQPGFNSREIVYLPVNATASITAKRADAKILSQQIEPEHLRLTIEAAAPTMMVIAQAFYHPWRAYVDGSQTQLWRANGGFQALQIPAGRHEIKLVYEDRVFQAGGALSCGTLLMLTVIWFRSRKFPA